MVLQAPNPVNGKDVRLRLVLHSSVTRQLSVNISVQAMRYNGLPAANIQSEVKKATLHPLKGNSSSLLNVGGNDRYLRVWTN